VARHEKCVLAVHASKMKILKSNNIQNNISGAVYRQKTQRKLHFSLHVNAKIFGPKHAQYIGLTEK
jgi:hypothetical protein